MGHSFKKRQLTDKEVAQAQQAAATAPIAQPGPVATPALPPSPAAAADAMPPVGIFQVGQTYEVPLGRIRSNPVNPRAHYTLAAVDSMAESLQKDGQLNACTGFANDDGTVTLIEGETRFRGARTSGRETLRIEIRPKPANDRKLYEEARATNVQRREQTVLDDATRWSELLQKGVYASQRELGQAFQLSDDEVSRIVRLARLPQRLIQLLAERQISDGRRLNAIREYWDSVDEKERDDKTYELIELVAKNQMSYREIEARRKAEATGPQKRTRGHKEVMQLTGSAKGELTRFPDGRLEFSVRGLEEGDVGRFHEALKDLCARLSKPA